MAVHFHPQPKPEPRAVSKHRKRVIADKALADAYADVDTRDGSICWVTGRYTVAGDPDSRRRREHHHLKGRNVKPEWVTRPERIITVCAEAHALITAGWLIVEGTDARKPLFFHWREDVQPQQKPFQIQPKRRSA